MNQKKSPPGGSKLDKVVAEAHKNRAKREQGYREKSLGMYPWVCGRCSRYREKSLGMYPWVCGRCSREFTRANVHELTVHHRDHNHDNNPEDGSNWELLCVYCHDNEHARYLDGESVGNTDANKDAKQVTHNPLAGLGELLKSC
jgi:hypothetical protein